MIADSFCLVNGDGLIALKSGGQSLVSGPLGHILRAEHHHRCSGGDYEQSGQSGGKQSVTFLFHRYILPFRRLPSLLPEGAYRLFLEAFVERNGVKGGTVVLTIHVQSSFNSFLSRSRPRDSRVPTVGEGRPSVLAISWME